MNTDSVLGRQMDEYRLETLLGRGGMARVYRALDARLRRYAAVKVIETRYRAEADYIQRFESEAQAIARLDHPNIVKIYRFGEAAGCLYIAMQYVAGINLGVLMADYRRGGEWIEPDEARRIIHEVGSALDYAHSQGVIHRDIKPSNIMLDEHGRAIVTDFGLALLPELEGAEVFGSPHYMSPEQVVASNQVTAQSDLYSLGIILYEMFTGQLPFQAAEPTGVAAMHLHDSPPAPRQVRPALSASVEAVILKCLAKDPAQRFATCQALADALDAALEAAPEAAAPPTLSQLSIPDRVKLQAPPAAPPTPPPAARPSPQPAVAAPAVGPRSASRRARWRLWAAAAVGLAAVVFCSVWTASWGLAQFAARAAGTPPAAAIVTDTAPGAASTTATSPATATPEPQNTPAVPTPAAAEPAIGDSLVFTHGPQDNYLVISHIGQAPLALAGLVVGDGDNAIQGSEWGVDRLEAGACLIAWRDDRTADRGADPELTCVTGERVIRAGRARFWRGDFSVYYNGALIGECEADDDDDDASECVLVLDDDR